VNSHPHILKVVQLFNSGPPGQRAKGNNATLLKEGIETEIISPYGKPWNIFANAHNALRGLDLCRALYVLLFRRRSDLIFAHLESAVLILLLRKLLRFRVPVLIWEVPWSPGWKLRDRLSAFAIPRADACVVFGRNQIGLVRETYKSQKPIHFVRFCVDLDFYKPGPASKHHGPATIWSCGLDVGRDFETLINALDGLPVQLNIKAPQRVQEEFVDRKNLQFEDRYLAPEEFRDRYRTAEIVVVSTKSTPNASGVTSLMEALACGCATIVTENPGIQDYIPGDEAAITVPIGDHQAIREAVELLLAQPERAALLRQNARRFAEQSFSQEAHHRRMAEVIKETISATQSPAFNKTRPSASNNHASHASLPFDESRK
jgi:glycosyltransferase involved in cell wall biosynthesis